MDPVFQGKDVGLGGGLPAQRAFVLLTEGSLNTDGLGQKMGGYQVWWKTCPHLVAIRLEVRSERQIAQVGIW